MQERSSLLGKVVHIEHSCHSYERTYGYCGEIKHAFRFVSVLLQESIGLLRKITYLNNSREINAIIENDYVGRVESWVFGNDLMRM